MRAPHLILPLLAILVFSGCVSQGTSTGLAPGAAAVAGGTEAGATGTADPGTVSIPLKDISETAKFFEYESGGATIRFFAAKGSDGSVKTAFDACDVCYYTKKGYSQQGSYMVCNNCGNRYPIDGLGTENRNPGGCWPSYLPNQIAGDNVVIKKADLEKASGLFA